eukprot:tig00001340_g8291.t1
MDASEEYKAGSNWDTCNPPEWYRQKKKPTAPPPVAPGQPGAPAQPPPLFGNGPPDAAFLFLPPRLLWHAKPPASSSKYMVSTANGPSAKKPQLSGGQIALRTSSSPIHRSAVTRDARQSMRSSKGASWWSRS